MFSGCRMAWKFGYVTEAVCLSSSCSSGNLHMPTTECKMLVDELTRLDKIAQQWFFAGHERITKKKGNKKVQPFDRRDVYRLWHKTTTTPNQKKNNKKPHTHTKNKTPPPGQKRQKWFILDYPQKSIECLLFTNHWFLWLTSLTVSVKSGSCCK